MIAIGYVLSSGGYRTRAATALIQPGSNSGPSFAAVAIAFNNDPEILGAMTALIFMQIVISAPIGSWMGRNQPDEDEEEGGEAEAGEDSLADAPM